MAALLTSRARPRTAQHRVFRLIHSHVPQRMAAQHRAQSTQERSLLILAPRQTSGAIGRSTQLTEQTPQIALMPKSLHPLGRVALRFKAIAQSALVLGI